MADVKVMSPTGELGTIPEDQLHDAVERYGYRVPTEADLAEASNQKKYGEGLGNELKAGAAGVARGATLGLSDTALTKTGLVDPNTLSQLKERNPASSLTGEIAGGVGSMVLAPELSPAGLLAKGGGAIAKAVAPAALAEGAGLGARVLNTAGNIGARALGSAVEGAAYGAGQSVTEDALGDPDVNGERILSNVGLGALFGGALGGVVKAGEIGIPASFAKAREVVGQTYEKLIGKTPELGEPVLKTATAAGPPDGMPAVATGTDGQGFEPGILPRMMAKAQSKLTGTPEDEILESIKKGATSERMSPRERDAVARDFAKSLDEHYKAVNKASADASQLARPQESAALLEGADPGAALLEHENVISALDGTISEMKGAPELYPARFPKKLEMLKDAFEGRPLTSAPEVFRAINELKGAIDTKIPWGKEISGEAADAVSLVKELRSQIKDALEKEDVWGEAGARQQAYNSAANDFLTAKKEFQKRFMYKVQTPSGGVAYRIDPVKVGTYFNAVNDARGAQRSAVLKEFFSSSRKLVGEIGKTYEKAPFESFDKEAVSGLLAHNEETAERAKNIVAAEPGGFGFFTDLFHGPGGLIKAAAKHLTDPHQFVQRLSNLERASQKTADAVARTAKGIFGDGRIAASEVKAQAKSFEKMVEETHALAAGTPEGMIDKLEGATRESFVVAPKIAGSIQQAAIRGAMFLQSKIPEPPTPRLPMDDPYEPSKAEKAVFERYYAAVHDPVSVMRSVHAGRLTPQGLEALQTVYPRLYGDMQRELLDQLAGHKARGRKLSFQKQMTLSAFLGSPLTSALQPQTVLANQQTWQSLQGQKQAQQAQIQTTAKGLGSLGVANRMKTALQGSSDRRDQ